MKLTGKQKVMLTGASVGALVVSGVFVYFKARELQKRAAQIQASTPRTELARQAQRMEEDLAAFGESYANTLAQRAGEKYMAETYGLTAERIASLERLGSALGV